MTELLAIDFAQPIPLFPLAACALLPHATVPLHIFEPRYQTMTREAIDGVGLIAMAVFQGEQWKVDYTGNPPIRDHVCVGYIVRHQRLPDGRYNILLQGICRARILREVEHEVYRLGLLEPTESDAPMEIDLADQRSQLEALLADPLMKQLAAVNAIHGWLSSEMPTAAMVDLAILTLSGDAEQRYAMLAEPSPEARAEWLEHHLRQTLQTLRIAQRLGPATTEDGVHLN